MIKRIVRTVTTILIIGCSILGLFLVAGSVFSSYVGYQVRIVESGSMAPTIPTGSAIILRSGSEYRVGDVVTFRRNGVEGVTTHRIIAIEETVDGSAYVTQGDANNVPDRQPLVREDIFGKVLWHIPYLGFVISGIRTPTGFVILIVLPVLYLVYGEVQKIIVEVKKQRLEKKKNNNTNERDTTHST